MLSKKSFSPACFLNRYRLARDYLRNNLSCRGFPNELTVELTNYCNLNCVICPRAKMTRAVGFMDFALFCRLVDQAVKYVELIDLDLYGESLFHPQAIEMIEYCKQKRLKTIISTNLTSLTAEQAKALVKSGLDAITLSLDGATPETYEQIRKGGNFVRALENLETLLRIKRELRAKTPFTILQMVYTVDTCKEADQFLQLGKRLSPNLVRLKPYLSYDRSKNYLSGLKFRDSKAPCLMLWRKLTIFWDGLVGPCCNDYDQAYRLGDAKSESLKAIWNGKAMQDLRKMHREGKRGEIALCRDCRPFLAGSLMILGSVLVDDLTVKKLLPFFEKLVIKGFRLLEYS